LKNNEKKLEKIGQTNINGNITIVVNRNEKESSSKKSNYSEKISKNFQE
jgi:hypothetical protein